jgi:hypothetical protein
MANLGNTITKQGKWSLTDINLYYENEGFKYTIHVTKFFTKNEDNHYDEVLKLCAEQWMNEIEIFDFGRLYWKALTINSKDFTKEKDELKEAFTESFTKYIDKYNEKVPTDSPKVRKVNAALALTYAGVS